MKTYLLPVPYRLIAALLVATALLIQQKAAQAQCSGLGSIVLNVVAAPQPTITGNTPFCQGNSTTLTVPQSFATYNWSTGGSGPSISVSSPGNYTVTVTNSAGCTGTAVQAVTQTPAPAPTITTATYQCNGQFILNAGPGFANYNWSNGASSQTTTVSTPGTYLVTVTNAAGCSGTDDISITIPPPPVVDISGNLSFCTGSNTVLSATPGFSQYAWSGGGNGSNLTVNTAGTFTVTATDAFGCTDVASTTVQELNFSPPTISGGTVLCPGASLTLTANGPNYTGYNWSNGQSTQAITVNTSDIYIVTVTAANGCTGTASITVNPGSSTTTSIIGNTIICNGSATTLIATGSFQSYNWSNGSSGSIISVNQTGPYTVTVTTTQGCTGTAVTTVTAGTTPNVSIAGPTEICPGSSIALSAQPGGLSSYVWSTGSNGQNININQSGAYSVTATYANGCTGTASYLVTPAIAPQPVIAGPPAVCAGTPANLSVASGFSGYNWSTGENTPAISVSNPGIYSVTVTGANGCTGTDNFNLIVNPVPTPNIVALPYACNGQLNLNAGAGYASYSWSTGQTINPITVSADGVYSVTVTGATGCTGSNDFFADIPNAPIVSISGNGQLCQGSSTVLEATPGLNAYVWSTGQTGSNITVNTAQNYEVTATDAFGCTATDVFPVQVLPNPSPTIAGPTSICAGGTATFSVPGNFSAYSWSTGNNTSSITVSSAGTYTVTVTAANGCTAAASQTLSISTSLEPQIAEQPYNCDGQIGLDAGAGFSNYAWSSGATSPTINVNTSGLYTVTVSDNTGCTGTDVVTVNIPDAPVVGIDGPNTICQNTSGVLEATPGFSIYVWSNGQVGATITVTQAGTYSVTATDAFGCEAAAAFNLSVNPAPTPTISGPSVICSNSSGTLSAAGNFQTYLWSTAENTPAITVNTADTYTVTVTNSFGCTGTAAQTVAVVTNLEPEISALPYACDGQITLDAGTGFATYTWSNGQTTPTVSANTSGDYTVTVTDATGCTGVDVVAVTIPDPPVAAISGNLVFCENAATTLAATPGFVNYLWNTGAATPDIVVNATGNYDVTVTDALGCTTVALASAAAQPLPTPQINGPAAICTNSVGTLTVTGSFAAYAWSTTETTQAISVNAAGDYSVTVTDQFGCTGSTAQTVSVVTNLEPEILALPYVCDEQITLYAGTGFATYTWSNGQTTPTISVNTAGDYTITVTDATGCTGIDVVVVTIPDPPVAAISGNLVFCENAATTLAATPGFVNYLWNTGDATPDIMVNATGNYDVTVTDALGCTTVALASAAAQPLPTPQINGPAAICTNSVGTLTVAGNFAAYAWSTAETTPGITVNVAGDYSVTVTDQFGCTGSTAQTVAVVTELEPEISALPYVCDGQITLDAGLGFATYSWSNGANSQTLIVGNSGEYSVIVSDISGCTGTATVQVNVPAVAQVFISGPSSFCQNESVVISATPGYVSYLWSTGATTPDISVNDSNAYSVTVTDNSGCMASTATAVTGIVGPAPQIIGPTVFCEGAGALFILSETYLSYTWSDGSTGATLGVNVPGDYAVTVTDATGCSGIAGISLSVVDNPAPVILAQPYQCDGQITLIADTGFSAYTWSNGQTTPTISVNTAGGYTVTVTDAFGCTGADVVAVTIPAPPVVAVSGNLVFCENATTTLAATQGFVNYLWNTGDTSPDISVNLTGNYSVTVTDALGCTALASASATAQPLPTPAITGTAALCPGSTGALTAAGNFVTYNWSTAQNTPTITVANAGSYTVTVTDLLGCTGTAITTVTAASADTAFVQLSTCDPTGVGTSVQVFPGTGGCDSVVITQTLLSGVTVNGTTAVLSNFNGFAVACAGGASGEAVATPLTGTAPFSYIWSNGATSPVAQNLGAGTYGVTFTDANGCSGTASVSLDEPLPVQPVIDATDPTCQNAGIIQVQQVTGGAAPYTVRLVQDIGTTNGTQPVNFSTLDAGIFEVEVTDANGCKSTETVVLLPAVVVEEFVSDTFEINKGDTVVLNAGAGITIQPLFITWTPANGLSCDNCLNPSIAPVRTTLVELDVAGFGGCRATGSFLIVVKSGGVVYAPNAIRPGSAENFGFTLYGDEGLVNIRMLQIYDRWGGQMAVFEDIAPNDPAQGWDGRFRGKDVIPGVYAWWAEVEYSDGTTEILSGDVTVVR